ncbi:hypothetical protein DNH61_19465 [Paenibacillus sambharensis]|uniref:DoxX family protein n=1 Tax=Paenibacillus sambharensis TaxID=1803190 RepID=A0A2W1LHY9_9BACL|nr:hypothetical protein [Paenibacillus sambharensis]PZD94134.1 hypothetical protein DNH61_19465 [Paenibacillus sambharensis]
MKTVQGGSMKPYHTVNDSSQRGAHRFLKALDNKLSFAFIVHGFWAMFWLLNGLDKFFNHNYFYGVTRDEKFANYFATLNLPGYISAICLYAISVIEILLAIAFVVLAVKSASNKSLQSLAFKISMLIFFVFSAGDILFGDRAELWEHGTFLILVMTSFMLVQFQARQDEKMRVTS